MMLLNDLYRKYLKDLQAIYSEGEAATITTRIFEHAAKISRATIIRDPGRVLPESLVVELESMLIALLQHKPVQYVTGEEWFCGLKFKVTNAVLIPRPETEELVMAAIAFIKNNKNASVIDIGTGSGCIAIALKNKAPDTSVFAIDISEEALEVARENALSNDVEIAFKKVDFLNKAEVALLSKFDVIISNPPYIPQAEKELLDKNVRDNEPHLALFVSDKDPLIFYKQCAAFAGIHLKEEGKIFTEIHESFANEAAGIFKASGFRTEIIKDMFGKERIVTAIRSR